MSLDEAGLVADVRSRLFAPTAGLTIGAELELIPVVAATRLPPPVESPVAPSLANALRTCALGGGWRELPPDSGAPSWTLPDASRVSFEPGGQIEISSRPHRSCSTLIESLQKTVALLRRAAADHGIELLTVGADPYNDIASVPLQLTSDRYVRMTRYLEARGEFGTRMMRQSAALHINVEHGPRPLERWALLNALAPYIIALFANSPRYAGRETGHASYRAHFWRELDASRTGIPFDAMAPVERYAQFALDAGAIRTRSETGGVRTFRSLLGDPMTDAEDWSFHLTTLFPEVRPKEYFEIRSPDTIAEGDLAAPLAFVAGVVYDDRAAADALCLLVQPDGALLRAAGREGLANEEIRARARALVRISTDGGSRLPGEYITPEHRAFAAGWLDRRVS